MKARLLIGMTMGAVAAVLLGSASPSSKAAAEPSQLAPRGECDALPDGVTEIDGLRTAIAIRSPDATALRLQFSSESHGCREPESVQTGKCRPLWQFGFALLPELQKPGVYHLNDYELAYSDFIVATTFARGGCNSEPGCSLTGRGASPGKGPEGTIEILSVTDTCVTGRVLGLDHGRSSPPAPDFTGGFRAAVCARE
jgi:hypothetical protein